MTTLPERFERLGFAVAVVKQKVCAPLDRPRNSPVAYLKKAAASRFRRQPSFYAPTVLPDHPSVACSTQYAMSLGYAALILGA